MIFLATLTSASVFGQKTKIMGVVKDAHTGEPVLFANVYFQGKTIGVTSGFNGEFAIETKTPSDTLVVSFIGYITQKRKITRNIFQELVFELEPDNVTLRAVEIHPGENPAEVLLRKIIANKEQNNKKEFDAYQYEVYTKIQFDANNISEKLKKRKVLKPFDFVFDYMDTSTVNGKAYLPAFITETLSDNYYSTDPKGELEIIKASKMSGLDNESITQFMGDLYQDVNIYENYIELFEKNFISPIANFGLGYFRYYLIDSAFLEKQWCYHIMFKPRRKQELTFTGDMWIHDSTYAVKSVEMKMAEDANLNFVNALALRQDYEFINDTYWMLYRDYIVVDFNIIEKSENVVGFFGHKTTMYKDYVFNRPKEKEFYNKPVDVIVDDEANKKTDEYWNIARHEELGEKEEGIYEMVDSIKHLPIFRTYMDFFYMIFNGHLKWGMFEIGPYYKLFSYNDIEGARFRFGGQTSNKFSTNLMLKGHVAYGTKDQKFKYELGFLYLTSKNPRRGFGGHYKYDMEQLGASQNAFADDNLFSSFFRTSPSTKLSMVQETVGFYEHEWFAGFSNKISIKHSVLFPVGDNQFIIYDPTKRIENSLSTAEIQLYTRFAFKERFVMGEFKRVSLGTKYPVFEVDYAYGFPGFLGSEFEYHRLKVGVRQWFNVASLGWSKYMIDAGKIWGTLPYPLLKLMPGNETFLFDEYAYNLMDYYEFVSDAYIGIYYTHHFDGLLLNHIPFMRKLKWRTVIHGRGVVGTLTNANKNYSEFPRITHDLQRPYYEAGVGIENIFKMFRVDAMWRLSHRNINNSSNFALFLSFWFSF